MGSFPEMRFISAPPTSFYDKFLSETATKSENNLVKIASFRNLIHSADPSSLEAIDKLLTDRIEVLDSKKTEDVKQAKMYLKYL